MKLGLLNLFFPLCQGKDDGGRAKFDDKET